jgi:hypothetical protein
MQPPDEIYEEAACIAEQEPELPGNIPMRLYFEQIFYSIFYPEFPSRAVCRATKKAIAENIRKRKHNA